MIPNLKHTNYVSVRYKSDDELTELERMNKQQMLKNIVKEEMEKRNLKEAMQDNKNNNNIQLTKQMDHNFQDLNKITRENGKNQLKPDQQYNFKDISFKKKEPQNNSESTENDFLLAQILQQKLNESPNQQYRDEDVSRSAQKSKNQKDNIDIPPQSLLTEKDKRFLQKQQQELDRYINYKEQQRNEDKLIEVNEDFINNVFNKQYPNNQKIIEQIKKDQSSNQVQQQSMSKPKNIQEISNKKEYKQKEEYISPNKEPATRSQNNDLNQLLRTIESIQYCTYCGEYQRESQLESHKSKCRMAKVHCDFCNQEFPRYIINDHTGDCLRREENKLLDLYQRAFAEEGLNVNKTHHIFLGSRDLMRRQFNQQTFEQQKEIERLIIQNQKKIKQSYLKKATKSEFYAEVKYVKDPTSAQAEDCCICFNTFIEKEALGMLPCAHKFHTHCIDSWIKVKKLCPLCKRPF